MSDALVAVQGDPVVPVQYLMTPLESTKKLRTPVIPVFSG
jgi:hypothetical protein